MTDTMLCTLPTNLCGATGPQFRLLFTQDPQNMPCYKLTASNPGQFYYNAFYIGTPGSTATFTITLPYPWVTQGAQPIHAYDSVSYTTANDGTVCLTPGNVITQWSTLVTLANYSPPTFGSTYTFTVTVTVPASGFVYLNVHLDYGLKGSSGYSANANLDATLCQSNTIVIGNNKSYGFGLGGSLLSTQIVSSCNAFKKNPGVGVLVQSQGSSDSIKGANTVLKDSNKNVVTTAVTDDDGWGMLSYKATGKASTYYVITTVGSGPGAWTKTDTITLKANGYVEDDVTSP